MMEYPIVQVTTKDRLPLFGLLSKAKNSKTILIGIHGTASNFYENMFMEAITKTLVSKNISVLATNNRGTAVYQAYPVHGAAVEKFEDCLKDVDAWIKFSLDQGYKSIILQGHSLGTEKVIYYMNKGRYRNKVKGVILLAVADSYGYQIKHYSKNKINKFLAESKAMVRAGKGKEFLRSEWFCYGGVMPKSAVSFINFMTPSSAVSKSLALGKGKELKMYRKIPVPILAVIGDQKEYTVIPIKRALKLLEKENKLTEAYQIRNSNHDFEGKEGAIAKIIGSFVSRL